jgi:cytidine deaminase
LIIVYIRAAEFIQITGMFFDRSLSLWYGKGRKKEMNGRSVLSMTEYKKLIEKAMEARSFSYSPYSNFRVGAALLAADGTVYTGCNIENASFSVTNCAERTAFFKAVSEGKREFEAIAIVGAPAGKEPDSLCPPCGVCRQVMMEFCDPESFRIILGTGDGKRETHTLKELLPLGFSGEGVKRSE